MAKARHKRRGRGSNHGEDMSRTAYAPFVLLLMVVALVSGCHMFATSLGLIIDGVSTTGIVTMYREDYGCGSTGSKHTGDDYQVRFTTSDGRKIAIDEEAPACSNMYRVGERVPVLYDPANPYEAKVNNFYNLWGSPLLIIIFGLVGCCLFGALTVALINQLLKRNRFYG